MIDFRYHIVSIVAIFLSLAIGLVLGASFLQDTLSKSLKASNVALAKEKDSLRKEKSALSTQVNGEEQFAAALTPQIVDTRLKDQSVVFIMTPGGSDKIYKQLNDLVRASGGHVTGEVTVQQKYFGTDQSVLDALAGQYATTVQGASTGSVYDRAGAVLASALVTDQASKTGRDQPASTVILSAFTGQGFITTSGQPGTLATLAIVIAPSTPDLADTAGLGNKALISLAGSMDNAGRGTVVTGPLESAQDPGLLSALRNDAVSNHVSTVDTADFSSGQVVVVLALQAEMAGKSGKYGVADGDNGYLPSPIPAVSGAK